MIISNSGKITINISTEPQIEYCINHIDVNTIIIKNPSSNSGKEEVIYI